MWYTYITDKGGGLVAFDQNQYVNDFKRQNYDKVLILLPKGRKQDLKAYADTHGKSMTQIIIESLESHCKLDLSRQDGE